MTETAETTHYASLEKTDFSGLFPQMCELEVIRTKITNYAVIRWTGTAKHDDYLYGFAVTADGKAMKGAVGDWAERAENYQLFSFAADEIGSSLTIALTRTTFGNPVKVVKPDGTIGYSSESIQYDTVQQTFTLKKVE